MKKRALSLLVLCALCVVSTAQALGTTTHWTGWARRAWRRQDAPAGVAFYDPKVATLGATLLATGTAPPVVTLTGTLTVPYGIRVEITTGGARGTALFRVSIDNGSTYLASGVTTAATYPIAGTLVVLNFPTGTNYTNDNVYRATIATWPDLSGRGLDATQATSTKQPLYLVASGLTGVPGLQFDGTDDFLASALVAYNQPCQVFLTMKFTSAGTGSAFDGKNANHMRFYRDTSVRMNMLAGSGILGNTTPEAFHYYQLDWNNASGQAKADNVQIMSGTVGTNNCDGVTLAGIGGGTSNTPLIITGVAVYNAIANATDTAAIVAAIKAETGL